MTPLALQLERELQRTLPTATLTAQSLPELDNLSLYLLNPDYPRTPMSSDEMQVIWQEPAYWIFCWAKGVILVLAKSKTGLYLLGEFFPKRCPIHG